MKQHLIDVIVLALLGGAILNGCASKHVIVRKDLCKDLEVYGTVIPTHSDCTKE